MKSRTRNAEVARDAVGFPSEKKISEEIEIREVYQKGVSKEMYESLREHLRMAPFESAELRVAVRKIGGLVRERASRPRRSSHSRILANHSARCLPHGERRGKRRARTLEE